MMLLSLFTGSLHAMPPVQRMQLSNGLTVLISEEHSLPFVTIQLLLNAGSSKDPHGEEGLSRITAQTILLGTARMTALEISKELDFIGASLNTSSGRDYTILSLRVLKKDIAKGLKFFMETLTQPVFPEEEINREIEKTLGAIQSIEENPGAFAEKEFRNALYMDSPYGHPVEGTKESLSGITRDKVLRFYKTYYHITGAILAVVGDITPDEARIGLLSGLEKLPATKTVDAPFNIKPMEGSKNIGLNRSISQASIILGHLGVSRDNPDFYTLTVMNYILGGGGFASRLTREVRSKRGLAYSIDSFFDASKHPGSFQVMLQTKNASAKEAISLTIKEMERIRNEPVAEDELEAAKNYLIGSFPLRLDSQSKLAGFLLQSEYYGLGLDYHLKYPSLIGSVTRDKVLRAAKTYLHPDRCILVVVGNLKEAGLDAIEDSKGKFEN